MARIRTYKPEFFSSATIGSLSIEERLFFLGLISMADDYGVLLEIHRKILGDIFPWDNHIGEPEIIGYIESLIAAGLLVRCEYDGRQYLVIRTWGEHQKVDRPGRRILPKEVHNSLYENDMDDSRSTREDVANDTRDDREDSSDGSRILDLGSRIIGPRNKEQDSSSAKEDADMILATWNEMAKAAGIPSVLALSASRRKHIAARMADPLFRERWGDILAGIRGSPFLRGQSGDRKWTASLDWVIGNDTNYKKILEGRYAPTSGTNGNRGNDRPALPEQYRTKILELPIERRRDALARIADPDKYDLTCIGL